MIRVALVCGAALLIGAGAASAATITEFRVPSSGSEPFAIANGPDGALWFTESGADKLGRITTRGSTHEFPLPTGSGALGLATGPDRALWLAAHGSATILRVSTGGAVLSYQLTDGRSPYDIAAGPDGAVWFTAQPPTAGGGLTQGAIEKITTDGHITAYPLTSAVGTTPISITAGPDGNLWFTEQRTLPAPSVIGRITPTGQITEFAIPTAGAVPTRITKGPDGALWFTDQNHGMIGRSTTSGQITEFHTGASSLIDGIASGPDGALWFTDRFYDALWRITTSGAVAKSLLPGAVTGSGPQPYDLVTGPDHALWFTIRQGQIGRLAPGATGCTVPRLLGLSLTKAKQKLAAAHCRLGKVRHATHRAGRKGKVVAQQPAPGTRLPAGGKVAVSVSK